MASSAYLSHDETTSSPGQSARYPRQTALVQADSMCSNRAHYLAFNLAKKAWGQHPSFKKMAVTAFLQALNFAVVQCDVSVVFKVAQVRALEAVYLGRDVIGVLPTGYGKSVVFLFIYCIK